MEKHTYNNEKLMLSSGHHMDEKGKKMHFGADKCICLCLKRPESQRIHISVQEKDEMPGVKLHLLNVFVGQRKSDVQCGLSLFSPQKTT